MMNWYERAFRPSKNRLIAGLVLLAGFAGRVAADEPADGPLPEITPAQLAAKLREAMGRYDDRGTLRVVFTETKDTDLRFVHNEGPAAAAEADAGLVPRPGPLRRRRDAMAHRVRRR